MANAINLIVMGGSAAPYNASGPAGNPYSNTLGGVVNGISESMTFEVANILRVNAYVQPTGNPYPAVNSIVRYKSINPTNGNFKVIRMYVNDTQTAIKNAMNA